MAIPLCNRCGRFHADTTAGCAIAAGTYEYLPGAPSLTLDFQPGSGPAVRRFDSGATRDADTGKLDVEGFLSPLVVERFSRYMHRHRFLADGSVRDSDNWQRGMPREVYMKSLLRHVLDLWLHQRGAGDVAREPVEEALCAVLFNVQGLLLEELKRGGARPPSAEVAL